MNQSNDQEYYSARAAISRDLAQRATDPSVAAIHADFAIRYELLAAKPQWQNGSTFRVAQAA